MNEIEIVHKELMKNYVLASQQNFMPPKELLMETAQGLVMENNEMPNKIKPECWTIAFRMARLIRALCGFNELMKAKDTPAYKVSAKKLLEGLKPKQLEESAGKKSDNTEEYEAMMKLALSSVKRIV